MAWRKSTYSGPTACVEVDADGPVVGVRDTKNRGGVTLSFDRAAWRAFLDDYRATRAQGR